MSTVNHKANISPLNKPFCYYTFSFLYMWGTSFCCWSCCAGLQLQVLNRILWQLGRSKAAMRLLNDWCHRYCNVIKLVVVQWLLGTCILHMSKAVEKSSIWSINQILSILLYNYYNNCEFDDMIISLPFSTSCLGTSCKIQAPFLLLSSTLLFKY